MAMRLFFQTTVWVILFQAGLSTSDTNKSSSASCFCSPVIDVSADGNGKCDLCDENSKLLKEVNDLKKELATIKNQISQIQSGSPNDEFDLHFPKRGTSDYVIHHGLQITKALTVCFRVRTTDRTGLGRTIVSYSLRENNNDNEILINRMQEIQFGINVHVSRTEISVNDGFWHHVCVSWENTNGSWKIYKDGVLRASGTGKGTGHVIKKNGILIIGQEQDSFGGEFDDRQNYIGELTDLNMWNKVLNANKILKLSKSCHRERGNVKKWSDFKFGIRGDVRVVSPSACEIY